MLEMYLRQPRFTYSACEQVTKSKKITKKIKKQKIQDIFHKTNQITFAFSMTWLMEIL